MFKLDRGLKGELGLGYNSVTEEVSLVIVLPSEVVAQWVNT
jgi:hypothetical protein